MKKTLSQAPLLLALFVMLGSNAAVAADSPCTFVPKLAGIIEEYATPTRLTDAVGDELIEKLAPEEIFAARPVSHADYGITFAREGSDTWIFRQTEQRGPIELYAVVRGPSGVAQQWLPDYHRVLRKALHESLRRGIKLSIATYGNCS